MGFHSLQIYTAGESVYDNRAYIIGCIYHVGTLKIYICHPIRPTTPGTQLELVITQIKAYTLTNDPDTFRQGVSAYRQAMAWTKQQRDDAIRETNEKVAAHDTEASPDNNPSMNFAAASADGTTKYNSQKTPIPSFVYDSDTSTDKLSYDFEPPMKRSKMS